MGGVYRRRAAPAMFDFADGEKIALAKRKKYV
jgi:hypothetical protein